MAEFAYVTSDFIKHKGFIERRFPKLVWFKSSLYLGIRPFKGAAQIRVKLYPKRIPFFWTSF